MSSPLTRENALLVGVAIAGYVTAVQTGAPDALGAGFLLVVGAVVPALRAHADQESPVEDGLADIDPESPHPAVPDEPES